VAGVPLLDELLLDELDELLLLDKLLDELADDRLLVLELLSELALLVLDDEELDRDVALLVELRLDVLDDDGDDVLDDEAELVLDVLRLLDELSSSPAAALNVAIVDPTNGELDPLQNGFSLPAAV
jgi:hypothetical protein